MYVKEQQAGMPSPCPIKVMVGLPSKLIQPRISEEIPLTFLSWRFWTKIRQRLHCSGRRHHHSGTALSLVLSPPSVISLSLTICSFCLLCLYLLITLHFAYLNKVVYDTLPIGTLQHILNCHTYTLHVGSYCSSINVYEVWHLGTFRIVVYFSTK